MRNLNGSEVKGYFIPCNNTDPKKLFLEKFFDAVDSAVRQVLQEQDLDYDKIDLNKLNVCITKAYVMKHNSKRIYKLLCASNGFYRSKFYRTIIVNVED